MSEEHSDCPTCKIPRRYRSLRGFRVVDNWVEGVIENSMINGGWDYRLEGDAATVCVQALDRALDAMKRSDPKLVKREIEYVREQIA